MTPGQRILEPPREGTLAQGTAHEQNTQESAALKGVDPAWAWGRYEPSARVPWGMVLASHLHGRAGFGAAWDELQRTIERGPQKTIDELLRAPEAYAAFADEFDAYEAAAARSGDAMGWDAWWIRRLHDSPWPLLEKLTLFWHGHFAIRSVAVGNLKLMQEHVQRLRKHAFGELSTVLGGLADDPAMYTGLGGEQNRKAQPNLRFARPWLEAFTVGPEAATVPEVTNLARAWTGWFVYGGKLRFIEREHDGESKSLLGHEGKFGRDDAVRLLAGNPHTARNLARRLFRAFVSESGSPPDSLLAPISERIERGAGMDQVLEAILRSNLFFSSYAVGQRIKSPVELVVGLTRSLGSRPPSSAVAADLANLGQRLDGPPTVHGWAGGAHWLNTITMAGRVQLCQSLVRGSEAYGAGLDPARVAGAHGHHQPESQARFLIYLLLPGQLPGPAVERLVETVIASPQSLKALLERIVAQPEFQLA